MWEPGVDGRESQVIERGGIRVRRSLVPDSGGPGPLVRFSVESDYEQPVAVRISDGRITPESSGVDVGAGEGDCRWDTDEGEVTFGRSVLPKDSFVTGYRLPDVDRAEAFERPPIIRTVQPIDGADAEAGVVPQWRGNGGTVLAGSAGTAVGTAASDGGMANDGLRTADNGRSASSESPTIGTRESDASIDCLVAIPAYNEAETIADVVSRAEPHADEVLVIDDGSRDDTVIRAREASATVVEHERNRGYGAAIRRAFREARQREAANLIVIDGDGQHDPADIPQLLDRQTDDHSRIVIGSRFVGDQGSDIPVYRRLGLSVVNAMTNLSMGTIGSDGHVKDTQSGFRAYNAAAIASLADDSTIGAGMGASTDVLHHARQHGFDIEEVGTRIEYNVGHASSHNPIVHGLALVSNLLRTIERDHPIALLGVPGFLSSFVGLVFGYWMVTNYAVTGVFSIGLAISTSFFLLIGVFACFTAIILHSLNRYFDSGAPMPS
jgi:glycosyltransferase involved in cell wall biosynthesis